MVLRYTRNKQGVVQDMDGHSVLARSKVEDTFFAAEVEMVVRRTDLEITSVNGTIKRSFNEECMNAVPLLQKAVGLRIGSGITRTVESLIGGSKGCPRMADLVLECCNELILRFTLDQVENVPKLSGEAEIKAQRMFLKLNPRLKDSCIAFAKGSPLRED